MKTLFLIRHAHSSRDDPRLADSNRPLDDRGRRDAATMAGRLAARGVRPDSIIASPAVRALTTARIFAEALGFPPGTIAVERRLYAAEAETVIGVIRAADDRQQTLMLFGHNPEFTDVARRLGAAFEHLPTCAVVEFDYERATWSTVGIDRPARTALDHPKTG